jgi:membrane dipeptidase
LGLTHASQNRLAEGNNCPKGEGLSRQGRATLKAMASEGLILDCSHLNERSFYQALDTFKGPVMASHTGIRELHNTPRNLFLAQVKEIRDRGGVVGIAMNPELLWDRPETSVERVYAHLDTVAQHLGPEVIVIGSDACGFEAVGFSYSLLLEGLKDLLWEKGYGDAIGQILCHNLIGFLKGAVG